MIDRTSSYQMLQHRYHDAWSPLGSVKTTPLKQGSSRRSDDQRFKLGTELVARELNAVEQQIELFIRETRQRSLYDDSGTSFATGTEKIKTKLQTLSKTISQLDELIESRSSLSKQQRQHRVLIVTTLKKLFSQRAKEFKDNLQKRTDALTSRQAKQIKEFGASKVQLPARNYKSGFNPAASHTELSKSAIFPKVANGHAIERKNEQHYSKLFRQRNNPPPLPPAPSYAIDESTGVRRRGVPGTTSGQDPEIVDNHANYDKLQKSRLNIYDRSHKQARRAIQVQQAETIITELSSMFTEMASMVAEQGEVVQRIDDNLDISNREIQRGQGELLKYYNNLSKERALILKILATVLVLGIVFLLMYRR